jgi:NADP-dependent 3-hydroxy acid dehydrogenase YdfG
MTKTNEKTAVITGAAGGIGNAIARRFVESGFRVIAGDTDTDALEILSAELDRSGQKVWENPGDLQSKDYCKELIDYSIKTTGRLDVLVNNAGIITRGNVLETTDEDWARTFDVNLTAIFYTGRSLT